MRLAKLGYYGGDPDNVRVAPVTTVLDVLNYEAFESDYQETDRELNADNQ